MELYLALPIRLQGAMLNRAQDNSIVVAIVRAEGDAKWTGQETGQIDEFITLARSYSRPDLYGCGTFPDQSSWPTCKAVRSFKVTVC
jgi:hypothetical protein